ncbi:hypothetical protein [Pseudogemmobacter faecipullorum]|uniref:Translation initiation factor 2 n=1 Tax=Pseudogemmobacter faecipullorum TaxID=2755041 RepID=A0ABS8CHJ7_9RHOB|nr:hypothetical protein [Pseudogemmobacter faecipullorum]MCB5408873.1 hypothetical protein [Pseudogemmobacter faecipullorum]
MLRTISIGSCISVQGLQIAQNTDGTVVIRVDDKTFTGRPVMPSQGHSAA